MTTPSPTVDEIGADTRKGLIIGLAVRLFPEDGYETADENEMSSVFQLLCEVTRVYTELGNGDHPATERDQAWTLQSVLENVAPSIPWVGRA